jgi:hypothetical protein
MTAAKQTRPALVACAFLAAWATAGTAQVTSNQVPAPEARIVVRTPGAHYEASPLQRTLFGSGWRDVWTTPVAAPVLDIATYAGGLEFEEIGGGFHSRVLHLKEDDGWREYRFRSVDKYPTLPPQFKGTLLGDVWEDQVSILFPAAPLLVPPLLQAVGLLHVDPALYVMGDSPRLGEGRAMFAGMLGTMELKGQEAPDDKPGFAGSSKIKGTENFLEDISESREHRLNERELLAARLVDFLVNDVDRSRDNYDWARFGEKGAYTWRPLPRDRDQAFVDARGLANSLIIRRVFPKQIPFGPVYDVSGLTYTSYPIDRRLLQRLDANDFREVALRVQRAITDSVIDEVIRRIPREWRATDADERISRALRARRDAIPSAAMQFYADLAGEVDVHGTDEADRVDVFRHPDGRVTVTIDDPAREPVVVQRADGAVVTTVGGGVAARDAFYARTFLPSETNEVRIYAAGGDDIAVVRGTGSGDIVVRVIGGEGNDALADSAGGAATFVYDADGSNRLTLASGTRFSSRPWRPMEIEEGFRLDSDFRPDWGGTSGLTPAIDYNTSAGVILGVGHRARKYGFRRVPHKWELGASLLVGTGNGRLGVNGYGDYRFENSPRALRLEAQATQLEATRFFGYGNNTADVPRELSVVEQKMLSFEPALVHIVGYRAREGTGSVIKGRDTTKYSGLRPTIGELRAGPVFAYIDPEPGVGSPLATSGVVGSDAFGLAGARAGLELDRTDDDAVPTSGWRVEAEVSAFPTLLGLNDAFGTASAGSALYLPLGRLGGPHVALRVGGALAAGEYPAQFAPAIGGRRSLRGYSWRRFAGDAAVNGGAELRVPLGTYNLLLLRSQVGVFGLADAGRVWFDGASDGGWHTGVGGGFWFAALGRSVSVAYANGEGGRLYLSSGLFY